MQRLADDTRRRIAIDPGPHQFDQRRGDLVGRPVEVLPAERPRRMHRQCRHGRDTLLLIVCQPRDRPARKLNPTRRRHEAGSIQHEHQREAGIVGHGGELLMDLGSDAPLGSQQSSGRKEIERLRHGQRDDRRNRMERGRFASLRAGIERDPDATTV